MFLIKVKNNAGPSLINRQNCITIFQLTCDFPSVFLRLVAENIQVNNKCFTRESTQGTVVNFNVGLSKLCLFILASQIFKWVYSKLIMCLFLKGDRLNNFKVKIGNDFSMSTTDISQISEWSTCAHVPGL